MKIKHQCQQTFLLYYTIVITDHLWQIKLLLLLIIIIIVVFDLYRYYYIIIIFLNTNENILLLKLIISIRISIENPSLYSHKNKETSQKVLVHYRSIQQS